MITHDFIRDIRINQNKSGYRFSVDALILASFVSLPRAQRIADLGAGSGIIGLLLARQYAGAEVMLVELQESLAKRAKENIALNNLEGRVQVVKADVKEICMKLSEFYALQSQVGKGHAAQNKAPAGDYGMMAEGFDLVVSNPPFRRAKAGLLSLGDERAVARHELMLSLKDLVQAGALMLKHHGKFCIIHLPERLTDIIRVMNACGMEPKRLRPVHSNASSEAKMVLVEAVKGARTGMKVERPLFIFDETGNYTEEMQRMYSCDAGLG